MVFALVTKVVIFPQLRDLTFNGLQASTNVLKQFFASHNKLQHITLENMDVNISSPYTFDDILGDLADFEDLKSFRCSQISQNDMRIAFPNHCDVSCRGPHIIDLFLEEVVTMGPYEWVQKNWYVAYADLGEDVPRKMRELSQDVVVTGLDRQTDNEESYIWNSYY